MTNNTDTVHRPWGFYTVLAEGENYKVKRIFIKEGHRLSLQRHTYRSEQWTIVKGTAFVTIDGISSHREPGTHVHVPLGAVHRIGAPLGGVTFIEVQTGPYLGEDDIERLEDDYRRAGNDYVADEETVRRLKRNLFDDTAGVNIKIEASSTNPEELAQQLAAALSRETGLRLEPYDAKKYEQFNSAEEPEQKKSTGPCDCGNPVLCNIEPEEEYEMEQSSFLASLFHQGVINVSDVVTLKMNNIIGYDEAREILQLPTEHVNRAQ